MKLHPEDTGRRQLQLLDERDRLRGLLDELRSAARDRDEFEPHDVTDDMAAIQADKIEARIDAISKAIDRMGSGDYGLCEACESPIAEERLDALPATAVCVECS